jgi:hypothetical protein
VISNLAQHNSIANVNVRELTSKVVSLSHNNESVWIQPVYYSLINNASYPA